VADARGGLAELPLLKGSDHCVEALGMAEMARPPTSKATPKGCQRLAAQMAEWLSQGDECSVPNRAHPRR